MADTCAIITPEPAPNYELLAEVNISNGYKQMLRPLDRVTSVYATDISTNLIQMTLASGTTYNGPKTSFLYIATNNPVQLTMLFADATTAIVTVNNIFVSDTPIASFTITNLAVTPPTVGVDANVRVCFTGGLD